VLLSGPDARDFDGASPPHDIHVGFRSGAGELQPGEQNSRDRDADGTAGTGRTSRLHNLAVAYQGGKRRGGSGPATMDSDADVSAADLNSGE